MNKMRLTRDRKWGFQFFPYHQMHMDNELVKGWVSINYLTDGETMYWEYEKAGKVPVCGKDMLWLTIIPDDKQRCIGAYFLPNRRVSTWYVDVIDGVGMDDDGVVYYIDKYLDVLLTPQGDVKIADRDELDAAYASGELTQKQYEDAILEGERIVEEMATDIAATEKFCIDVLDAFEKEIADDVFTVFLDVDGVLDVFDPAKTVQELLPEPVKYLKDFVRRTKAELVVISDWRCGSPIYREKALKLGYAHIDDCWEHLVKTLTEQGIAIKGVTPWEDGLKSRTGEIKKYLEEHPSIKRYVILDDCYGDDYSGDENLRKHLVFVDALKGLQITDLLEACRIMNLQ